MEETNRQRTVWIYSRGSLVAESTFILSSKEWYLVRPDATTNIVGDMLVISEKTDIDSISVSWGSHVQ